ncbi:hypothetical protein NXC14_CH02601 [Rhizobium sp. NXC14]|nr:hypothetical protein NXC14_CH02601 [Rhizobium sp. NXC14]
MLVTLAIGAVFLGEASELNMARLAAGTLFICWRPARQKCLTDPALRLDRLC